MRAELRNWSRSKRQRVFVNRADKQLDILLKALAERVPDKPGFSSITDAEQRRRLKDEIKRELLALFKDHQDEILNAEPIAEMPDEEFIEFLKKELGEGS